MALFANYPAGHKPHWIEVMTEDGQKTREVSNLMVEIKKPSESWPVKGSGWKLPALEEYYQNEILSSRNETGFEYTYGERLRAYAEHGAWCDQVQVIIDKLKANRTTRRAVACTWDPHMDNDTGFHPPCLMVADFKIREEALHAIYYFRSQDIGQGWPQNVYGLYRLQDYIASQVDAELGTLTTISASAHIYLNPGDE